MKILQIKTQLLNFSIDEEQALVQGEIVFCTSFVSLCMLSDTNQKLHLKLAYTKENLHHITGSSKMGHTLGLVDSVAQ